MPRIEIEVPEDLLQRLREVLPDDCIPGFAEAALREWVTWMDGSARPMSISELETQRAFEIYDRLLVDEVPSADHLGELLGLPMGRARYIAQSLAYRHGNLLRARQAQAILRALENGRWSETGDNCVVIIDRGTQTLMDRTIRGLAAGGELGSVVQGSITVEGVRYDLGPGHHQTLIETFRGYRDR
jgi:hypothetical protein